ncbi:MAG: hypothetical protein Kow001_23460 [Acidobacteriota bacterium]
MALGASPQESQIRLRPGDTEKLCRTLEQLLPPEGAGIYLISRSGQELAAVVRRHPRDRQALASLAAGVLAAAQALGEALGRSGVQRFLQWGPHQSLLLAPVGERAVLLLVLDRGVHDTMARRKLDRAALVLDDILAGADALDSAPGRGDNGWRGGAG